MVVPTIVDYGLFSINVPIARECRAAANAPDVQNCRGVFFCNKSASVPEFMPMAILSIHNDNPLIDGRQSQRAMMVRRGVQRFLYEMRHAVLPELTLASGRRADLISISPKGEIWIVEIKTSIEDFRVDRKWPDYRLHCDRLFFATHSGVPLDIFPEECGLFLSDGYGARDDPRRARTPACGRRRANPCPLNFARVAAQRLMLAEWSADRAGETESGDARDRCTARATSDRREALSYFGARFARMRCSVRRCMLSRRAVSETLRSHIS